MCSESRLSRIATWQINMWLISTRNVAIVFELSRSCVRMWLQIVWEQVCKFWDELGGFNGVSLATAGFIQTVESPEIKVLRFPDVWKVWGKGIGHGKPWKSPGILKWSWKFYYQHPSSRVTVYSLVWLAHYKTHSKFAVRKSILFGISVVTFEVSSCTKFRIFWGSTMDPAGEFTGLENTFCESWKTFEFALCKSWKTVLMSVRTLLQVN